MSKDTKSDVLDNNYPLMIRLRERAPGTYSHSKAVANLLESVAVVTGLPEHMLKIAGFYHDIGKTVAPRMFTENQSDGEDNPHDVLSPRVSLRYITAHVGDTAQILINDSNIPRDVIRWCTQHHGTCVTKAIYWKRKKENGEAKEDDYRYPGQKPECLESALLMVCDILEATTRSMSQAGKLDDIDQLVEQVLQDLEQDEQLDDVELTFGKLRMIKSVLKRELAAQYHKRVDYEKPVEIKEKVESIKKPRKKKIVVSD